MNRGTRTVTLAILLAAGLLVVPPPAPAATVTGQSGYTATIYDNVFAGATITSGPASINNRNPDPTVDLNSNYGRLRKDGAPNVTDGYMQFVAAAPFTARTVISVRGNTGAGPLGNAHVKLGGTTVQDIPDGDWSITTTPLSTPVTTDTMRIEYPNGLGTYAAGTYISDIDEVLVLPDELHYISGVTLTGNSPVYYSNPQQLFNEQTRDNSWFPSEQTAPDTRWASFDLPEEKTVGAALILAESQAFSADFQRWTGAAWETFMTVDVAAGDIAAIKLPDGVTTGKLRIDAGSGPNLRAYQEVMLFEVVPPGPGEPIPEPATLVLIGLGLVGVLRRRCRFGA